MTPAAGTSKAVVVDGRPLQPGFKAHLERGIGRYSKNLLAAMVAEAGPEQFQLLVQADLGEPVADHRLPRLNARYASSALPKGKRVLSHHWLVRRPLLPAWREGRVVHFLAHLDAPAWIGPHTVLTVHDLIAQKLAGLYQADKSGLRFRAERWLETRCLFKAARLIAVSRQTAADLTEIYGIAPERITVIPEACDPGLAPVTDPALRREAQARYGLDPERPFFLYVGGIDQRKDLATLLAALLQLRQEGREPVLAMAGKISGDKQYPALQEAIAAQGLGQVVRELGYVPDADLPALFGACAAFVFPSLYEGFGLPPLEAMTCGAPVVAIRASAVPEVVGEAGILIGPGDAAALAEAMRALLDRPELGRELSAKGLARAREFSWQRAARQTLKVYREVSP